MEGVVAVWKDGVDVYMAFVAYAHLGVFLAQDCGQLAELIVYPARSTGAMVFGTPFGVAFAGEAVAGVALV